MQSARPGDAAAMSAAAGSPAPAAKPAPTTTPAIGARAGASSVVLAFAAADQPEIAGVRGLSLGIMSATQGDYATTQMLLDITQGARAAGSAYPTALPPALPLRASGAGAVVEGWQAARRRAEAARQLLRPGLLAAQIPGGAGYAGVVGVATIDGAAAADRQGRLAAFSRGSASTLLARIAAVRRSRRLVIADLPGGPAGRADLRALGQERTADELLIVVQRVPNAPGHELLWAAVGGLMGGGAAELSSQTTNQRGLIASVDLAPTILRHLGLTPIPAAMRGKPIHTDGPLHAARLRSLMARLEVIGPRRLKALGCLLVACALLLGLSGLPWGGRAGSPRARAWAMRAGALGLLWAPVAVLLPAGLEPSPAVEYAAIAVACLTLGALTDRLLAWPRALLAPAVVAVVALSADALAGTQLLIRSLLGPNPALGVRFYGIGNELKSGLAVLVLAAVAGVLYPAVRGRVAASTMALSGVALAVVEGAARIGAGVGGVILVSAGTAVATVMLLPGPVTRRRTLIVLASPIVGLLALAALDLATAHGGGHFTGSVLHARSTADVRDIIVRRYTSAYDELKHGAMPFATALALALAALGVTRQRRLLAAVDCDPAWLAALAGGLTAGVVGALSEDSGPLLLVVAVFALGCVATYLWGRPPSPTR
jgi:hypothetical protein